MEFGTPETVHIDRVIPYWRNPRRLNADAVQAVKASIEEYGYSQPVVVDNEMVIIIGHTRYAALRKMKIEQIPIVKASHLTPNQVKQLRVIDNRSGEYAYWDFEKMAAEITAEDSDLIKALFPEASHWGEASEEAAREITEAEDGRHSSWDDVDNTVEFVCPTCFHEWEATVTREDVMSGRIEMKDK